MRGYDPVLAVLLFCGALALHSRQLDLKLRLDYLWATQVFYWHSPQEILLHSEQRNHGMLQPVAAKQNKGSYS